MNEQLKAESFRNTWTGWISVAVVAVAFIWFWQSSPSKYSSPKVNQSIESTSSAAMGDSDFIASRLSQETLNLDGKTTWQPNLLNLPRVMQVLNLAPADPPTFHIHQNLEIYIDGKQVPIPQNIGFSDEAEVPTHTHNTSGVLHVESTDINLTPTLGLFFDVWGVKLTNDTIGGYVATGDKSLKVFVDGKLYTGDPRQLALTAHQEIVVTYGTSKELPRPIPSHYIFGPNE